MATVKKQKMKDRPKGTGGYRVYINAKEAPILMDILANDVNFSDYDEHIAEKEVLITKLLTSGGE